MKHGCQKMSQACFVKTNFHDIVARDGLGVKLWDIRQPLYETKPYKSMEVNNYINDNLSYYGDLNCLNNKSFLSVSPCGKHVLTGDYNSRANIVALDQSQNVQIDCQFYARFGQIYTKR